MNLTNFFAQPANLLLLAFSLVALVQIFYYLFFFTRLAFHNPAPGESSQNYAVSVIVCARDEAENLVKNLPGVLVQEYHSKHEVIVVNDNSRDESKYILEELQKTFRHLQIVELKQEAQFIPGKKYPLSIGIKTAKHEILLLTDADCVPASEHWIEKMQALYTGEIEIVLGYGAFHKKKGVFNKIVRWETFHTALQYLSYAKCGLTYMGVGRNLSYKKSVFFRHKGFSAHNHLPGGDDDLFINRATNKRNTAISTDQDTFTISDPPENWKQWRRQKARHYTTSKYYKSIHKFLLGLYAFSHFCFYPLFVICLLTSDLEWVLGIFVFRLVIQIIILHSATRKLNEKDLFPWFLLMDIWMFFYYLIYSPSLFKKPAKNWQ